MTLQDFSVVAALGTAFAAVIVAPFVQFYVGRRQTAAAQLSARASLLSAESAGHHSVARFRQEWINTLRSSLSEFHSILMTATEYPFPADQDRKLSELGTRIELLLNPDEVESEALISLMNKLYDTSDVSEREKLDPDFIRAGQAILKKEWRRVKSELQGADAGNTN